MENRPDWGKHLEASIRRIQEAIAQGQAPQAGVLKTFLAAAGAHALDRVNARMQARLEKERRREERRQRRREEAAVAAKPQGFVFGAAAAVLLYFALTQPHLWWMVFIAFGFGMAGASLLAKGYHHERLLAAQGERGATRPQGALGQSPALALIDGRLSRVDETCERILAEMKSGPQVVREVVQRPQETLQALRAASHELGRRERELRTAVTPQDEQRLQDERARLGARAAAERDAVARERLESALRALDAQLAQRATLATAAARFEAEGTRILYTLENLYTQILRARSADAASAEVAGAGLRRSVEQLGLEVDAVAEALEAVNREELPGFAPIQEVRPSEPWPPSSSGRVRP